jgi:hypothetical protein
MADQTKQHRSLSEISHLFLSSVREKQMGSRALPQRKPPAPAKPSVDLTPEEFAQVFQEVPAAPEETVQIPPVKAVLAGHLGAKQLEGVKRYARSLAASGQRVGLVVVDVSEFRLVSFDERPRDPAEPPAESGCFDGRAMSDALNELSCDLDQWLLLVMNPRVPEARTLLRDVDQWVLLSGCDHEGIVGAYRTLKGLSDVSCAKLSLAALDAHEPAEAERVFQRLSSVCTQFLTMTIEPEPAVGEAPRVSDVTVMCCQVERDRAQLAAGAHWQVMRQFLSQARRAAAKRPTSRPVETPSVEPQTLREAMPVVPHQAAVEPVVDRLQSVEKCPATGAATREPDMTRPIHTHENHVAETLPEVLDLPAGDADEASILTAVMRHAMTELVECPLRPPMHQETRLAVSRDRRIVLIAVARQGLDELKNIGRAYQWVVENRALLAMALPQLAMDAHQLPHLWLLVDQANVDAQMLRPMVQSETVRIHTYRQVRWGEKRGLLLDAA